VNYLKKNVLLKKVSVVITTAMLFTTLLSGCGKPASDKAVQTAPTKTEAPKADGKVKGKFEVQIFVGGYGDAHWKKVLDGFKAQNPEIEYVLNMGPKVNEQLKPRWMSDDTPDFVYADGAGCPDDQYVKDGKLLDLTSWLESIDKVTGKPNKDKFVDKVIREVDGKKAFIPLIFGSWGMWYNEKLLSDNGIAPANNFDEFMAASEKLKSKGVSGFIHAGIYPDYIIWGSLLPAVGSEGGEKLLNDVIAGKPDAINSVQFKNVVKRFKDMADKDYFDKGATALNHTQSQMEWLNGKAAYIPVGLWLESEMKKDIPSGFSMKFTPSIFVGSGQKLSILPTGQNVAISSKAKNKEAALAFLQYLCTEEVQKIFVETTGAPSCIKINANNLNVSGATKSVQEFLANPKVQFLQQTASFEPDYYKAMCDGMTALLMKKIDVDGFCKRLVEGAAKAASAKK
jgi:N-acetylglucosamine transport system substrate-binding protein